MLAHVEHKYSDGRGLFRRFTAPTDKALYIVAYRHPSASGTVGFMSRAAALRFASTYKTSGCWAGVIDGTRYKFIKQYGKRWETLLRQQRAKENRHARGKCAG
jgi:hypothetical protein